MELDKTSKKSDALANLYRAALYLAQDGRGAGIRFLARAEGQLGSDLSAEIRTLLEDPRGKLDRREHYLFWAEKTLDEYLRLR